MTSTFAKDFGPFDNKIWLNTAHQGALPRVAVEQAHEAIAWKIAPYNLTTDRFSAIPPRLKQALGKLIDAPADDIILGNSASYGLHLLANGIRWQAGDEVLLMMGDFPSAILPWLGLQKRGVNIRFIEPRHSVIDADDLLAAMTPKTKLVCTTWVHSFSGFAVDAQSLGEVCRAHNVLFVMNTSQAIGARPFSVQTMPVDAISNVGFKWLCGPYGTGFCWMRPELRESLDYNQSYWLAMQTADDLMREQHEVVLREGLGARAYDVFGTANFFNFKPWTASLEYLLEQGIDNIEAHDQTLVSRFIAGLDEGKYNLLSPREGAARSTLIFISHQQKERNAELYRSLIAQDIYPAFRNGRLRFAPHLYNTEDDIDAALAALNAS
ncbi:MAG TPA: aminotransferase class V-fold PLP-dependent enzyme [Blastocatellia bacterium]|nr:aminotransferase class V-fold PLP-dependent enzyme [Blastocatellia bacterium]